MAFDGIYIYSLIKELEDTFVNSKVDKVNQPEKDEIILSFRGGKKLLISASSVYPRLHITTHSKPNPLKAPMFCMLLRKYLQGAKLESITQVDSDRLVIMKFLSVDELGFDSMYSLIIEIMGRHSNITLVRDRDNIIMDSIKHVSIDMNSYRCIYSGIPYVYPPKSTKLNPKAFSRNDVMDKIKDLEITENIFSTLFTGVSKIFSKELFLRFSNSNLSIEDFCINFFSNLFMKNDFSFNIYKNSTGKLIDFYCLNLESLDSMAATNFLSPSEIIDTFYYDKDKQDRLYNRSMDLQKLLNNNIDRCEKKVRILNDTLRQCEEKEDLKIKGELITANIYSMKQGDSKITVQNYYNPDYDEITIDLDPMKTPSQNVQHYFKKYNKLKKAEESALEQLTLAEEELNYLNSVYQNIKTIETYDEIDEIRRELVDSGYIKFHKGTSKKSSKTPKLSKPMHFISSDGYDIYVGKNNMQNDHLTLKFADKTDIWLHTKNIPGSHVIIKGFNIPDKTLEEAANLAAHFSKASNSSKVPVDYTEVRNVKKPSGSKPGMVIYSTNKTIYIDPIEPNLNKA